MDCKLGRLEIASLHVSMSPTFSVHLESCKLMNEPLNTFVKKRGGERLAPFCFFVLTLFTRSAAVQPTPTAPTAGLSQRSTVWCAVKPSYSNREATPKAVAVSAFPECRDLIPSYSRTIKKIKRQATQCPSDQPMALDQGACTRRRRGAAGHACACRSGPSSATSSRAYSCSSQSSQRVPAFSHTIGSTPMLTKCECLRDRRLLSLSHHLLIILPARHAVHLPRREQITCYSMKNSTDFSRMALQTCVCPCVCV